jgi:2-iminobutanoate/2-iminopropanoate deaminase
LPYGAGAAISAIATRNGVKRANGSASFCAADGPTIFCSSQTGAGANERTIQSQVQAVMKKLQAGLAAHGADFSHIVATNVYLNDIREFKPMNETYATFFSSSPPTRTTVQPFPIIAHGDPPLARISLVAVKE